MGMTRQAGRQADCQGGWVAVKEWGGEESKVGCNG